MMRMCVRCGEQKPEEAFRQRRNKPTPTCRACHQAVSTEWRRNNPDRVRAYNEKQRLRNPEYKKRMALESHYRRKFGITIAERDALLAAQGGKCAICDTTKPKGRGWCVDHSHRSGRTRAILCASCNVMIGLARESTWVLQRAIDYLGGEHVIDDDLREI